MNIEDCRRGMKVKCISNELISLKKGRQYTIKEVMKTPSISQHITFKEAQGRFSPVYFVPVNKNKFKIGEEVIYKIANQSYKAKILYITDNDYYNKNYLISIIDKGDNFNKVVKESHLSKVKKKDEYELLIDDIRETASVCIEENNQRKIVFDRLNKLEKINCELIEVLETILSHWKERELSVNRELTDKIITVVQKAKGGDK